MSARVLVVDDDPDVCETMQLVLEDAGCEVLVATDGRTTLDLLRNGAAPCLVLLDLMMPGMNGWQFLEAARREGLLDGIPVVVVSGGRFRKQEVLALGVAGYLEKPLDFDRLIGTVREYCKGV
jgi:CheY-like chemotaxis protein